MPVPNKMADLATLASSNFPTGTESIGNSLDDYIRSLSAIIRSTNAIASSTIAAASTTDIGLADGESVIITGASTINSFGAGFVGCYREVRFQGACTLVNSASIVLPGAANLVTAAGDVLGLRCTASGVWALVSASRDAQAVPLAGGTMTGNLTIATGAGVSQYQANSVAGVQTILSSADPLGGGYVGTGSNHPLRFYTNNAQRMDISTAGRVGIGKAAGANILEMQSGTNTTILAQTTGGVQNIYAAVDGLGGYLGCGSNHNVGIYANNVRQLLIETTGNVTATGNLISNSDERLKTHWRDLPADFIDRLAQVKRGVYDRTDIAQTQVGVSAQSLREILPDAVAEGPDGKLSVAYGNAALIAAIEIAERLIRLEGSIHGCKVH